MCFVRHTPAVTHQRLDERVPLLALRSSSSSLLVPRERRPARFFKQAVGPEISCDEFAIWEKSMHRHRGLSPVANPRRGSHGSAWVVTPAAAAIFLRGRAIDQPCFGWR